MRTILLSDIRKPGQYFSEFFKISYKLVRTIFSENVGDVPDNFSEVFLRFS